MTVASLPEIIREKQRQLADAEALTQRLRAELQEAGQLLSPTASGTLTVQRLKPPGSSTDMAEAVLVDTGEPLHVGEIISSIERQFGATVRYATLVGNISRLIQKGKTFERVAPNTFGLLTWRVEREAELLFGRDAYDSADASEGVEQKL